MEAVSGVGGSQWERAEFLKSRGGTLFAEDGGEGPMVTSRAMMTYKGFGARP